MESLVYGHAGQPMLVFPTSMGRFFEYEDRGMIGAVAPKIERGELQVFCPDAVDTESWYNKGVHPRSSYSKNFPIDVGKTSRGVPACPKTSASMSRCSSWL